MKNNIHAVIMAGGAGKRFWPFSTEERPKQFLNITGEGSLLELTLKRVKKLTDNIWVLTNQRYKDLVLKTDSTLNKDRVIGEPLLRDTAAAIALGAGLIRKEDPDSVMVVLPSDHIIKNTEGFIESINKAVNLAETDSFVTIGIKPTFASSSFGYIKCAGQLDIPGSYKIESFVEKPDSEKAEKYLQSGNYFWNAGMFIWKTENILVQLKKHLPRHAAMAETLAQIKGRPDWDLKAKEAFEPLEKISIDFGIMEKLSDIAAVESSFDWNDVGGWLALEELMEQDRYGNTISGRCITDNSSNNIIISENKTHPLIVSGINNSVIISAEAGVMICSKDKIEQIKNLVNNI